MVVVVLLGSGEKIRVWQWRRNDLRSGAPNNYTVRAEKLLINYS